MLPELGHFALILGLALSLLLGTLPLAGAAFNNTLLMKMAKPLAGGQFVFIFISFIILGFAFLQDDFSVQYVANHSNTLLPIQYKISAIWGGHEGSLLLWALILSGWTAAVVLFSKSLPLIVYARVLSVMGLIAVGFLFFILLTSNPFDRFLPQFPTEGADLNPLLQDFGLIVHPPMLYMGYVGFSVVFAFAIAALLGGQLDAAWAKWSRPWTTVSWAFLTLGIALGSWWAYYELGWGGWWFWDPVENASFMPWLVGAALIHSLAATEKRGVFKSWTVLLAILTFSLSLLGTFLVRSGVLTSVHAFASDPARGQFILGLLGITLFCSLTLYAFRVPQVRGRIHFSFLSKETFLLMNNLLLIVAWVTVMLGTLYPLVLDFIGGAKLSIGPPYFNALFVPLMSVLSVMMGFGIISRWKDNPVSYLVNRLRVVAVLAVAIALITPFVAFEEFHFGAFLGLFLFFWIVLISIQDLLDKAKSTQGLFYGLKRLRPAYYGMMLGHIGFAITLLGVAMVSIESDERDIRMTIGDEALVQDYIFVFDGMEKIEGPNYLADRANFIVLDKETKKVISHLKPEKRIYLAKKMPMTEAAIDPGIFRDLYVAMGEKLEDGAWAVRIQIKPFIRWIWFGSLVMSLGGILAISDKRYRTKN
jgi:cytochrome c-type biogenesis protein CcmF